MHLSCAMDPVSKALRLRARLNRVQVVLLLSRQSPSSNGVRDSDGSSQSYEGEGFQSDVGLRRVRKLKQISLKFRPDRH